MDIIYTYHARKKIEKRKVVEEWIKETIKWLHLTKRIENKYIVARKLNGLTLKVVYVKEKNIKVITVYFIK